MKTSCFAFGALALVCALSTPSLAGDWRILDTLDDGRSHLGAVAVGNEIFAAGGSGLSGPRNNFDTYDVDYDFWRALPAMPTAAEQFAMVATGGEIYLIGGFGEEGRRHPMTTVQVFLPTQASWRSGTEMEAPRARHGAAAIGGDIYLIGGVTTDGALEPRVARFDIGNNRWEQEVTQLPLPRRDLAVVELGGLIYAIGGRTDSGNPTARVDIYDPVAGTWERGPDLPAPRASHVAGALGEQIHVAGGSGSGRFETLQDHYVLRAGASSWTRAEDPSTPRHSQASAVVDGMWYVLGGGAGAGLFAEFTEVDMLEVYDPAAN